MLLLSRFVILGKSMEPAFFQNQTIIASSIPYIFSEPKIGDVVVFKDEKVFLKRIEKIKEGKYFLTGDNKKNSLDSRKIGWIVRQKILGKVICSF